MKAPAPHPITPGVIFQPILKDGDAAHFYMVLAGPSAEGKMLCVNFTDVLHLPDCPCKVPAGAVKCLTKHSAVAYHRAKEWDAKILGAELAKQTMLRLFESASPGVVTAILTGAKASKDINASIRAKYGLI